MSRRVMRRHHREGWATIGVVALGLITVVLVVAGVWWFNRDAPAPATPSAETPSAAATPSPSWPVETQAPDPELVPGDGTFVDPASVDRTDPDAVAEAAAMLVASHDTALDDSLTDAQRRMGWLATQTVLDGLSEPQGGGLGAGWLTAAQYDGYSSPAAELIPRHDEVGGHEGHDHAEGEHQDYNAAGEPVNGYIFRVTYQWQGREPMPEPPPAETRTVLLSVGENPDGTWQVVDPPIIQTPVGG